MRYLHLDNLCVRLVLLRSSKTMKTGILEENSQGGQQVKNFSVRKLLYGLQLRRANFSLSAALNLSRTMLSNSLAFISSTISQALMLSSSYYM